MTIFRAVLFVCGVWALILTHLFIWWKYHQGWDLKFVMVPTLVTTFLFCLIGWWMAKH